MIINDRKRIRNEATQWGPLETPLAICIAALTAFIIGTTVASALDGAAARLLLAARRRLWHPEAVEQALACKWWGINNWNAHLE